METVSSFVFVVICLSAALGATFAMRSYPSSQRGNSRSEMRYGVVVETLLDPDRYHKYIRPDINLGKPLDVNVSLTVISLDRISDNDMDYTITFKLQQIWRDSRLDGTKKMRGYQQTLTMDGSLGSRIWVPDTYIVNSHTSFIHDVTTRNGLIRLYPNGTVLYVLRITSRVSCPMNLHKYPMDKQICKLTLESWSFQDEDLSYNWGKAETCGSAADSSVSGMEYVVLSQFNITQCEVYRESHHSILGNHTQLVLQFHLKRNMLFFLMQTYLPSVLLVVLSWISFWINMNAVPARVGLGATTVLAMTTLMVGVYNSGPRSTSYVKAVDLYVCLCYGFVFAALMEYAGAHFLSRVYERMASQLADTPLIACDSYQIAESPSVQNHEQNGNINKFHSKENQFSEIPFKMKKMLYAQESRMKLHPHAYLRRPIKPMSTGIPMIEDSRHERTFFVTERVEGVTERVEDCRHCESLRVLNKMEGLNRRATKMEKIDQYSRILFPAAFACFNAIYWWVYLTMEDTLIEDSAH